jgi:hypothetical protein
VYTTTLIVLLSMADLLPSFAPAGDVLYIYKIGTDSSGKPFFTLASKSSLKFAGKGMPTVISFNRQAGTGIVSQSCTVSVRQ